MVKRSLFWGFTPTTATNYLRCVSATSRRFVFNVSIDQIVIPPSHRRTSRISWKYFTRNILAGISINKIQKNFQSQPTHFYKYVFIRWLVSGPRLEHHRAVMIQESEYILKLETTKQVVSSFTATYTKKYMPKNVGPKQYRK